MEFPFALPGLRRFAPSLCALLAVASAAAYPLAGQSRNTSLVRGTVLLPDSTPVVDAEVRIRHEGTGVERAVGTNVAGRFVFQTLQPGGPYTLTVGTLGYAPQVREGIMLRVGEVETFTFVLQEQALEVEGVTVTAERAEVFNPNQVGLATRLDEVTVEALPILSRNFMDLAILSPLVKVTQGGGFSVLGQNDRYNAIMVDGMSTKDAFGLAGGGVPGGQAGAKILPLDAVAQYEVLVAPYDVRLSGFTGGVMNAVTRTGTNDWWFRAGAVNRTEQLIGDLDLPTGSVDASGVDRTLFNLAVGGPIVRDKAHFFVAGEFERRHQPPNGYNLGRDDPGLVRISPEAVEEFRQVLQDQYGLEAGDAGPYSLERELSNLFARFDWNLNESNRLTIRSVYTAAENDETPNRATFEPYELSSNAVFRKSGSFSASAQLFSDLGRWANELNFEYRRTLDETQAASDFPQIEVELRSSIEGASMLRPVRAGAQFFAQDNDLDQTTLRLTNSASKTSGNATYTFGVTGAFYDIDHRYIPGSAGDYFFADMNDLRVNAPQRYQRTVLAAGESPTVNISVAEWGAFAQQQFDAGKGLTFRMGIRVDVPYLLDRPGYNPEVEELFGHKTTTVPSGTFLISPRWGFNWQSSGRLRTQVRGGGGVFTGQIPFVWAANAFHNNGMRAVTNVCTGRWTDEPATGNTVPMFDPLNPPTECVRGDFQQLRSVVLFEEGFKYPQNFRFSWAVDQELSETISATANFMFNHAINQVVLEELDLGRPQGNMGPLEPYGGLERRMYGRATDNGFAPNRDHPQYSQALIASNDHRDWAFALTAEVRGRLGERLSFQTGYTFSRSFDYMSLTFNDMISNFGFNPVYLSPNMPPGSPSNFDRPHKVVVSLFGSPFPFLPETEISLLYTGQSGLPFSYVYRGDMNGDGYPGVGPAFDRTNDLIYVPEVVTEIPAGPATYQLLGHALEHDECLARNRGDLLMRNECRSPWQHRLDLRMSHTLRSGSWDVRLEADVLNLLNLLRTGWGTVQSVPPTVSLLEPVRRIGGVRGSYVGPLVSQWAGGVLPMRDDEGNLISSDPWLVMSPESQWQAQFGIRVTFGGAR